MVIDSSRKALIVAGAAQEKYADDVLALDLRQLSSVADFFIIATAASRPQARAIVEAVEHALHRHHMRARPVEGLQSRVTQPHRRLGRPPSAEEFSWVVVDCGDIVLHVFDPPTRTFYQLERLWGDAPRLPLDLPTPAPVLSGRPGQ